MQRKETGQSARSHNNEEFGPWDAEERFAALLECNNPGCKQVAAVCGNVGFDQAYSQGPDGEPDTTWEPFYVPKHIHPAPPVFRIPSACPKAVREELEKSFSLVWTDRESSSSRMRVAIEALLSEQKVPKTTNSKGKRIPLPLHSRIEKYKSKNADVAEKLLAIKWMGNVGSHNSKSSHSSEELMNAFALFANVLDTLYVREDVELKKIAKRINQRRGKPIRRRFK